VKPGDEKWGRRSDELTLEIASGISSALTKLAISYKKQRARTTTASPSDLHLEFEETKKFKKGGDMDSWGITSLSYY
jgi:hypothetical protein